jgi:hypothetical protein
MKISNEEFQADHERRNAERRSKQLDRVSRNELIIWSMLWVVSAALIFHITIIL